ncbi:colicin V production CvpA [Salinisphaera orenii MK-B5]|uniref:Colicin V production CvpA n=1 Tax=Salinisphaera orenii MK-B5 TaxID=856730 RepID=A0A423PP44_9GAMM|nr:CvpA family protein [Salinisphaera orenii]ROO27396.1 colicin V production CvpA [Salinisphaera orenii MK-B5]
MIWVDVAILAVIALSAIIGFFRGFLREALGLATWILALYLAFTFAEVGARFLQNWISVDSARLAVAFGVVFVAVLVLGAIVNYIIGRLVSETGFAGTDRALGGAFGVLRGVAVLVLLVLLAGVTPVPRDAWWQRSMFIGHLEDGALWARDFLPPDLAGAVTYPDTPPADAPAAP